MPRIRRSSTSAVEQVAFEYESGDVPTKGSMCSELAARQVIDDGDVGSPRAEQFRREIGADASGSAGNQDAILHAMEFSLDQQARLDARLTACSTRCCRRSESRRSAAASPVAAKVIWQDADAVRQPQTQAHVLRA